jgi:pyrimidine operon attenuation protein/uracil phosphoribosyltransferase
MTDAENTKVKGVMLDKEAIRRTLARMAHEIVERNDNLGSVVLLGIKTRGVPLASRIRQMIKNFENVTLECGALDVSDFRDDTVIKNEPSLPKFDFDIVGKDIILVDDVLFTGRTVRAGIEAIMEVGRPHSIQLAVLVDRGHRELPFRADFVGKNIPTSHTEKISVHLTETDGADEVVLLSKQ